MEMFALAKEMRACGNEFISVARDDWDSFETSWSFLALPVIRFKMSTVQESQQAADAAFLICGGAGDRIHAIWTLDYYQAMLLAGVPNVEMHLYGNGRHPGDSLPDGSRMSGGLTDRDGIPFGTWQYRFVDWVRDLGFLQKPGIETKAAKDVAAYVANPPRPFGQGRGGADRGGPPPAKTGARVAPAGTSSTRQGR